MAKSTLSTSYKDAILGSDMNNKRRYTKTENTDGTISLTDATTYTQVGSTFGATDINATNAAVNASADASKIIDSLSTVKSTTASGYMAGALAVKELANSVNTMTSNITYKGTKGTKTMIEFLDNADNAYGYGMAIGGGGDTYIGGGESAATVSDATYTTTSEKLYLCSDNGIYFYDNTNSGVDSANITYISGGVFSGTAAKAQALTTSAGSANQPVYFSNGKPVASNYTYDVSTENNSDTWIPVFSGSKIQHTLTTRWVAKTGGTMTGDLNVTNVYATSTGGGVHANAFYGINDSTRGRLQAYEWYVRNADSTSWVTVYAGNYSAQSSRLVKKNIESMSEDEARKLLELRPVTFDYKNEANGTNCRGLIAEEVEDIIPSCITKPKDCATTEEELNEEQTNTLGIDYSKLVPYLIKMVQLQEERISALEAKAVNE